MCVFFSGVHAARTAPASGRRETFWSGVSDAVVGNGSRPVLLHVADDVEHDGAAALTINRRARRRVKDTGVVSVRVCEAPVLR